MKAASSRYTDLFFVRSLIASKSDDHFISQTENSSYLSTLYNKTGKKYNISTCKLV